MGGNDGMRKALNLGRKRGLSSTIGRCLNHSAGHIGDGLNVEYQRAVRLNRVSMLVPRAFAMIGSSAALMTRLPDSIFATVLRVT